MRQPGYQVYDRRGRWKGSTWSKEAAELAISKMGVCSGGRYEPNESEEPDDARSPDCSPARTSLKDFP